MTYDSPVSSPRAPLTLALAIAALAWLLPAGCSGSAGGHSGRYQATDGPMAVTLDFEGGNKVTVTLGSPEKPEESLVHHCVYVVNHDKMLITTDEPFGAPMTLRVNGDVLEDDSGLVFRKK